MLRIFIIILGVFITRMAVAQSIEVMVGSENVFVDIQFLENFGDSSFKYVAYNQTRATISHENTATMSTVVFFNYKTKIGLGSTVASRITSTQGASGLFGLSYLKIDKRLLVYTLLAVERIDEYRYGSFSVIRYYPEINENWKVYSSLEVNSLINKDIHLDSVQRLRAGLDYKNNQFGLAVNLRERGEDYDVVENYGLFFRKVF